MTTPWIEKYRPSYFDDIVLNETNRAIFNNILDRQYFPNLLFYGPPGTGKTTTIINLINEYQKRHYNMSKSLQIHLNASDERGIDIVRNQIYTFVKSNNLFEKGNKFVILDEVDYMTKNAQYALKTLIQSCGPHVKFCLICNYISKVDESLKNEFICLRFNQLPRSEIYNFVNNICQNEHMKVNESTINAIQDVYKSDIRSMINFLQLNQYMDFERWKENVMNNDVFEQIHELLNSDDYSFDKLVTKINTITTNYNIDPRNLIIKYLDYFIKYALNSNEKRLISLQFLEIVNQIVHCSDLQNEDLVFYFASKLQPYYCCMAGK